MSGVKIEVIEKEKDVTLLTDVQADYVSLVKHGANRIPFRVVKSVKGGEKSTMKNLAIQSILLPAGTSLAELATLPGLEFLNDITDAVEEKFEDYNKYSLIPTSKVDESTLKMSKFADSSFVITSAVPEGKRKRDKRKRKKEGQANYAFSGTGKPLYEAILPGVRHCSKLTS